MNLFETGRIGKLTTPNRIVMAPLGRARNSEQNRQALERAVTYYAQRASAGLIISEASHISRFTVSRPGTAAVHSDGQIRAWQAVTSSIHAAGGRIFQQLFHLGRKADPDRLPDGVWPVAPSAIAARGEMATANGPKPFPVPRALETHDIAGLVGDFVQAAKNSLAAGFDGIELHGANGFLIEQFLREDANHRTDAYGGSVANRARFLIEVVDAVIEVIGADKVGVRISPHFRSDGSPDVDPHTLYEHVARELAQRNIAYLHLIEPDSTPADRRTAERIRSAFTGPLILAGGFTRDGAEAILKSGLADFVAFGRLYIANPDLVERFRLDHVPLNSPDESTFYTGGDAGYIDYPTLDKALAEVAN